MASMEFIKKISRIVSTSGLKEMNDLMVKEKKIFELFLTSNSINVNEWIEHVLDAYAEGGLVAAQ